MSRFSKRTGGAIIAAVFLMVGATSASAVTQLTTPASCSTEVRVASHTYGNTYHRTVMGQYWNKGFKSNSGVHRIHLLAVGLNRSNHHQFFWVCLQVVNRFG